MLGNLKHGYCQYPDCNLDLNFVHVATKYCPEHKILQRKQHPQTYHRERYKSRFHRDKVIGGVYKNPELLPNGLKDGAPCPGNGNGYCGAILRREPVMTAEGYSSPFFDYVCGSHRFPDPREENNS